MSLSITATGLNRQTGKISHLEQHSITLERFDERDFLGLARRIPQSDAFASVEDFDAASMENILKPLDKALIKLINMQSFEHVLLHCERRCKKLTVFTPRCFFRLVTSQNTGAQTIHCVRMLL